MSSICQFYDNAYMTSDALFKDKQAYRTINKKGWGCNYCYDGQGGTIDSKIADSPLSTI